MTEKISYVARSLPNTKLIAGGLGAFLFILVGLYGMFLNQTVLNIVARKSLEARIAEMDTEVSKYEFSYIEESDEVTLDTARSLGYIEETEPHYIKSNKGSRFTLRD
jgi:hypothetical protein